MIGNTKSEYNCQSLRRSLPTERCFCFLTALSWGKTGLAAFVSILQITPIRAEHVAVIFALLVPIRLMSRATISHMNIHPGPGRRINRLQFVWLKCGRRTLKKTSPFLKRLQITLKKLNTSVLQSFFEPRNTIDRNKNGEAVQKTIGILV